MTRIKTRAVGWSHEHKELPRYRNQTRRFARYVFQTDISRFYESTYTHVIPWAIHGKVSAKANFGFSLWGNELDAWVRREQDNQTFGIPIGPDTSFIIAETILSAIDAELCRRMPEFRGFRHVDDYEAGFLERSKAEEAHRLLEESLREYELALNAEKTKTIELPGRVTESWAAELRAMRIRRTAVGQETDLLAFFDKMFELSRVDPAGSVVKFGLGRMLNTLVAPENWEMYQDLLLQCIAVEVGNTTYVLEELLKYRRRGRMLDILAIEECLSLHIKDQARRGNSSEVAWSLWALIELGIKLRPEDRDAAVRLNCSPVHLLLLDLENRGLSAKGTAQLIWPNKITSADLYELNWLAVYEANVKGWVSGYTGHSDYVANDEYFRILKANKVSFYNPARTIAPPPAGRPPGTGGRGGY